MKIGDKLYYERICDSGNKFKVYFSPPSSLCCYRDIKYLIYDLKDDTNSRLLTNAQKSFIQATISLFKEKYGIQTKDELLKFLEMSEFQRKCYIAANLK